MNAKKIVEGLSSMYLKGEKGEDWTASGGRTELVEVKGYARQEELGRMLSLADENGAELVFTQDADGGNVLAFYPR